MAHIIEKCEDEDAIAILKAALNMYHKSLEDEEVAIGLLAAKRKKKKNGDWCDGPVLALRGYSCAATVGVTDIRGRALGMPDAVITINWEWWSKAPRAQRIAVMDHELTHLELDCGSDGPKRDDLKRPFLLMRKHDWEFGGFLGVVERHGKDAVEALAVKGVATSEIFIQKKLFGPADFEPREDHDTRPDLADDDAAPRVSARRVIDVSGQNAAQRDSTLKSLIEEVSRDLADQAQDHLATRARKKASKRKGSK